MLFGVRLLPTPCAQHSEHLVCRGDPRPHQLLRVGKIAQVSDAHAAATVLVLVGRTDPPPCRANFLLFLAGAVQELVIRQGQMGPVGHVELVLSPHAPSFQRIQLGKHLLGIEHHAVADDAHGTLENSGRDLM